jgi:hypothetical protein
MASIVISADSRSPTTSGSPIMAKKSRKPKLSEQSIAILWHGKTDMITVDVIHRRYFPNATIEAARSAIRRTNGDAENGPEA